MCNLLQFVNQKVTGKVMRNKWTLSGDLKSPGVKPVPVRFRLAAPRIPALSFEGAGIFLLFSSVSAISLKIFVPRVLAKIFRLRAICQQISTKTCFARKRKKTFCELSCVLVHNIQNHICCGIGCIHLVAVVQMRVNVRRGLIG